MQPIVKVHFSPLFLTSVSAWATPNTSCVETYCPSPCPMGIFIPLFVLSVILAVSIYVRSTVALRAAFMINLTFSAYFFWITNPQPSAILPEFCRTLCVKKMFITHHINAWSHCSTPKGAKSELPFIRRMSSGWAKKPFSLPLQETSKVSRLI